MDLNKLRKMIATWEDEHMARDKDGYREDGYLEYRVSSKESGGEGGLLVANWRGQETVFEVPDDKALVELLTDKAESTWAQVKEETEAKIAAWAITKIMEGITPKEREAAWKDVRGMICQRCWRFNRGSNADPCNCRGE